MQRKIGDRKLTVSRCLSVIESLFYTNIGSCVLNTPCFSRLFWPYLDCMSYRYGCSVIILLNINFSDYDRTCNPTGIQSGILVILYLVHNLSYLSPSVPSQDVSNNLIEILVPIQSEGEDGRRIILVPITFYPSKLKGF